MSQDPNAMTDLTATEVTVTSSDAPFVQTSTMSAAGSTDSLSEQPATQRDLLRLRRLLWLFGVLVAVLIAPKFVGDIQYALTKAKETARLDVARENLQDFNLSHFNNASRLLAQYVGPSVVNVSTQSGHSHGEGSGVIVDEEGYIVTNYHVVAGVRTVEIQLSDGRSGSASVVGIDPLVDVAVLKTNLDDLVAAKWGDSDELSVGESVWAFGSPFGFQKSITFGILSAKERRGIRSQGGGRGNTSVYQEFLQTDAAVNPGNSGGPLVNLNGEIIGINTAIIGPTYQGISFSIPSVIVRKSYEQLRKDGWVKRGYLGIRPSKLPDRDALALGLEKDSGVLIESVETNTPASDAGMQRGDVILSWNGTEFSDPTLMSRAIAATKIGSKVPVEIVRKSDSAVERLTLTVQVAVRPRADSL